MVKIAESTQNSAESNISCHSERSEESKKNPFVILSVAKYLKKRDSSRYRTQNDNLSVDSANRTKIAESSLNSALSTPSKQGANSSIADEFLGLCEVSDADRTLSPSRKQADALPKKSLRDDEFAITTYAIACIAFLICVFNPYALYATDITQFDSTQTIATLGALFGVFLTTSFIAIYAVSFIPKKFAKIPAFAFSLALFIGLIYSFILVGDYGAMDHFSLQKTPFDDRDALVKKAREFIAVVAFGVIFIALALKKLLRVWQIVLITLFAVSAINATNIALQRLDSANFAESSIKSPPPYRLSAPYANELFAYSKTQKNIVIIVLDMFSGTHTPHILEQFPHLKTRLDGFMHFPNTISSSTATLTSIASLIGGEHYAVINMNKRRENLASEINSAFISTANTFANADFSVSLMAFAASDIKDIVPQMQSGVFALDAKSRAFDNFYMERENLLDKIINAKSQTKSTQVALLLSFGLFRFAPEFPLRAKIHNENKWLLSKKSKKTLDTTTAISYAASFYALSRNVSVDSAKPTFKYIHSMMTHTPHGAYFDGEKCVFFDDKTAWDDYPHEVLLKYKDEQHYDAEACAMHYLADFVGALKNAGIYDNTQIFVISDHGRVDSINMPNLDESYFRPDVLFLFKDFGARGAIATDKRLMANYDIASIFCENLPSGCPNVRKNILKNYPRRREIIHTIPISWRLEDHKRDEWLLRKVFKVRGDIHNEQNWEQIYESAEN